METVRLTMAQALVRYLVAQRTEIDGEEVPLFAGAFAIFGHGNVTSLGEALHAAGDDLPTWRGQNEQSMAMAAIAYAKAKQRRQLMVATSSVGPGATNMVTAAGIAMANRLPVLLLSGDVFASRLPDPVLQQVEHFGDPTITVNDAFKPVVRYWDRITRPEQILQSLPQAVATMLDPADCGPAFIGMTQDAQAEACDYPVEFFRSRVWRVRRPVPDEREVAAAAAALASAERPLLIAGGGVHYSLATAELAHFATRRGIPVVETVAGKGTLTWDHPSYAGPVGVTGSSAANALAAEADVVLAVGTRLQDFTTGSWTAFQDPGLRVIALNAARFDAHKHLALPVVGDAREGLAALDAELGGWEAPPSWRERAGREFAEWNALVDEVTAPPPDGELPSYAQVLGVINREADPDDVALAAAGGFPGEINKTWRIRTPGSFDCEYGYSCMGYEIGGAWGAKMANPHRDVISFVGDGSYLMMNSDVYSTVLAGHKVIFVLCDNGGFAVINRLQEFKGSAPFNNLFEHARVAEQVDVDFAAHAAAMGARAESVADLDGLAEAFRRAKQADRSTVIVIKTHPYRWTPGDAWWEVGVPEVSERSAVVQARSDHDKAKQGQRRGV